MHPDTYHLYSTLKGQPNLGIWYLYQQEQQQQEPIGQPVRLDADLVNVMLFLVGYEECEPYTVYSGQHHDRLLGVVPSGWVSALTCTPVNTRERSLRPINPI